jgi:hypothetical protein
VAEWVERYRSYWEHTLSRLDNYLATLESPAEEKHAHKEQH